MAKEVGLETVLAGVLEANLLPWSMQQGEPEKQAGRRCRISKDTPSALLGEQQGVSARSAVCFKRLPGSWGCRSKWRGTVGRGKGNPRLQEAGEVDGRREVEEKVLRGVRGREGKAG